MSRRLQGLLAGADPRQRRTLADVARFFSVLLVLTLVARGTTGAVLPVVTTAKPTSGAVTRTLTATGNIEAQGGVPFASPEGLLVTETPVGQGQAVAVGQVLARFDAASAEQAIAAQQAELEKLALQIAQLQKAETADADAVQQAQRQLDRAYAEAERVRAEGQAAVEQARGALLAATPESAAAAQAQAELDAALAAAEADARAADEAAQQAEDARNAAQESYRRQAEALADAAALNAAEAKTLQVQCAALQAGLDLLLAVRDAGYALCAANAGTLVRLDLAPGQVSGAVGGLLADAAAGCTLALQLDEEQAGLVAVGTALTVTQGKLEQQAAVAALSAPDADGGVTATVALPDAAWQPGPATATARLQGSAQGLLLPATAIRKDNQGVYVLALEQQQTVLGLQNQLVRLPVTVQEQGDTMVAVTGADKPIAAGARVRLDG